MRDAWQPPVASVLDPVTNNLSMDPSDIERVLWQKWQPIFCPDPEQKSSPDFDAFWSRFGSYTVAAPVTNVKGSLASNAGIPKNDHIDADRVVARATGMAGRSTSSCTSSSASKEVNQTEGYSMDPMLPTLEEPFVNSAFPKGSTVLMRPKPRPSRWADGPTISIREGETSRTAMLRALQAPLPPTSLRSSSEPVDETPLDRRNRYQTSMQSDVSDRDLGDFLHWVCPDTPAPEIPGDEEDHNKAAESESEITDGSYSVMSSEESMPPSDPKLFFNEVYDV